MADYIAPGVYVEELGAGPKSIDGVETSTAGFSGLTRYGPVHVPAGAAGTEPRLVKSFAEFESIYGGLSTLHTSADRVERLPYVAHAARAFFVNGGRRLYVSRVFVPRVASGKPDYGIAHLSIAVSGTHATWRARWPGEYGNVSVTVRPVRGSNAAYEAAEFDGAVQAKDVGRGSLVEIIRHRHHIADDQAPVLATLAQISVDPHDGRQIFNRNGARFTPDAADVIRHVTLTVVVTTDDKRSTSYDGLETNPHTARYIGSVLRRDNPDDPNAVLYLDWDPTIASGSDVAAHLMTALVAHSGGRLRYGHDGLAPSSVALAGLKGTGLTALGEIDEIAVVALPDAGALADPDECRAATSALIAHAETLRYRIAVVDSPSGASIDDVRRFREQFDSSYAALYHPWVAVDAGPLLPPCGFISGVYARTDAEKGVHKAPANEELRSVTKLAATLTDADQDILSHAAINALRFFPQRGHLVWGARTISADPDWKYVNVRRLVIFLEHSIDRGTQWASFEPNGDPLWTSIRSSVENFLLTQWRSGALVGQTPAEAFFVRCDRTTMTQNDLDNGRLVCLVGVAPVRPAEFVIFRIGQWTADAHHP
jgi:hypothetical protein